VENYGTVVISFKNGHFKAPLYIKFYMHFSVTSFSGILWFMFCFCYVLYEIEWSKFRLL